MEIRERESSAGVKSIRIKTECFAWRGEKKQVPEHNKAEEGRQGKRETESACVRVYACECE